MRKIAYILLGLTLSNSCSKIRWSEVEWYRTQEGGPRLKDPTKFEYNTDEFRSMDKSLIDTSAIYVLESVFDPYNDEENEKKIEPRTFCRFFSGGQVLFISYDSTLTTDIINNPNIGTPGYFIIDGKKLKTDIFKNLNGGQTGKYFGLIMDNGDLLFYDQSPETYDESYVGLEEYGKKSFWRKVKREGIVHYKTDW